VNPKRLLIIGASGLVGRHIYRVCRNKGWEVDGTYATRGKDPFIRFDLGSRDFQSLKLDKYSHVVIAAGLSGIDRCFLNQATSSRINVEAVIALLGELNPQTAMPIFLSTDYVFDGHKGNYKEKDPRVPGTIYGKQKVQVEDYLTKEFEKYLILRLGKVVSCDPSDNTFVTDWILKLKHGKPIRAAEDQIASMLEVGDIESCLITLLERDMQGIYHLASGMPLSKLEIANSIAKRLKISSTLIHPCRINELGLKEIRPLNTYLNSDKFKRETGYSFMQFDDLLQRCDRQLERNEAIL
jgi:dTDP-4-dehydrorhamnose reductase